MKSKKLMSVLLASLMIFTLLAGCGGGGTTTPSPSASTPPPAEPMDPIILANCGWDSNSLHNYIVGLIAENAFGYTWEEMQVGTSFMLEGMTAGDIDVDMEIWSDQIATYPDFIASGKVTELTINFSDSEQGIYVPRYVIEGDAERGIEALAPDLKSVADLKDYAHLFPDDDDPSKGRIYSYTLGSATNEVIQAKVKYYELDAVYNCFAPGSDALLNAAITNAYEEGVPVATYYWSPTWLMGKYDFVLLEDAPYDEETFYDGATQFPACDVTIVANNDFIAERPEFCEFLKNYKTTSEHINDALAYMQENGADVQTTAIWFLQQNTELLDEWLSEDQAAAVKAVL